MDSAYWQQFTQGGLTADQINELVRRVTFPFRVYVHQPEIGVFYGGHQPMVLEYLVPIFLLGVACTFWRGRSPALLVLLWLIAAALGNSLLRDSAVYARYNVVFPAVALTMAVALRYLPPLLWHTAPKSWLMILTLLITGLIGAVQVNYYFGSHVETLENQLRNAKPYRDGFDAVMRAADLPGDTSIYLISEPVNDVNAVRALIGFLHPTPDNRVVVTLPTHQLTADFLSQLPSGKPYAFFVEPSDESTVRLLGQYFELGEPQASLKAIPLEKQYLLYFVPAAE
jgi:hypothetical protein